jgi:isoleucyl-tRNA synthetase
MQQIIADELNVKEVVNELGDEVKIEMDTTLTEELKAEGLARDLIRAIQNARKNAGFSIDDRINLRLESDSSEVNTALKQFQDTIYAETLTTAELTGEGSHSETVKVDGQEVKIHLSVST